MRLDQLDRWCGPAPDVEYHPSSELDELPDWCDRCEAFSLPVLLHWTPAGSTVGDAEACLACVRRALAEVCTEHVARTPIVVEFPAVLLDQPGQGVAA